jgi:hypothetical protein
VISTIGREDPGFRRRVRNIRPHAHDARGVAVCAHLSCRAFWSRASVIHVQGTIS